MRESKISFNYLCLSAFNENTVLRDCYFFKYLFLISVPTITIRKNLKVVTDTKTKLNSSMYVQCTHSLFTFLLVNI